MPPRWRRVHPPGRAEPSARGIGPADEGCCSLPAAVAEPRHGRQNVSKKVFIDGQEGTTGLGIRERLANRDDITLLEIPGSRRKDPATKREILASADVAI